MRHRLVLAVVMVLLALGQAQAAVQSRNITYKDGDAELQGYLAWDDSITGKRPGVLVVHEWWGLNDYARKRAGMLAQLGYVAFALDMYGTGRVTGHGKQAGEWMKQISANEAAWQKRAQLGLDVLRSQALVDASRTAAIGYCFGGATVMQLAYSGAEIDGVVSFHGSLPVPTAAQAAVIRASVLVEHGDADSFIPAERIQAFRAALDQAGTDWVMDIYGGARHGFTNPGAGDYGIEALKYDPLADRRSWGRMQLFLTEIFTQ